MHNPWGRKESDTTEQLSLSFFTSPSKFRYVIFRILEYFRVCQLYMSHEVKVKVLVVELCPTLCNPVDCSPAGFSVRGILQVTIPE